MRRQRRLARDLWFRFLIYVAAVVALLPLSLVLAYTISNGWRAAMQPDFYLHFERPEGIPGAVAQRLHETMIGRGVPVHGHEMVPVSLSIGCALFPEDGLVKNELLSRADAALYEAKRRDGRDAPAPEPAPEEAAVADSTTFGVLQGLVNAVDAKDAYTRGHAQAVTEGALLLVPPGLREAGLALGLPRWRVALQLMLRAAAPGVVTGALLAVARAAGETAPLLFTSFGNRRLVFNPAEPMQALPLTVFHNALTPYKDLEDQAWGAALLLVVLVLIVNLASRFALRRQLALAGRGTS